ncbi:translocation/assembly module TamB domain-containing protein [Simplicispira lacusdiani]|uniref:translocation/assembly module TamB domain-containing protein n=1 Tax=Simplicispira lacusdiani TaxID=2213010 RepID=UPI000E755DB8|nr:translocation/assembly module TamB domain-containing protein [Simplicispira lacusdiani]
MAHPPTSRPDAGPEAFAPGASRPPGPNPFAAAARPPAPPPARSPRRAWRLAAGLLGTLLTAPLLAGAAAWWWMGTPQSLATALEHVPALLPAGQRLEIRDVAGSLRDGGRIGSLRWSGPTLNVEAQDLRLAWRLAPLLQRTVQIDALRAATLRITPKAAGAAPTATPPQQWQWPVRVDAAFQIGQLAWEGPTPVQASGLDGRYRQDGEQHRLDLAGVSLAQGRYSGHATLQAQAPMALDAMVEGRVHAPLPGTAHPLELTARATLQGTLATEAARLRLQARLHSADGAPASALQANATADIAPWAAQPLLQAHADLQAVDLATLWPGAPTTLLHGSVQAGPVETGWQIAAQLRNGQPGPWDRQHLPVRTLDATGIFDGTHWNLPTARAQTDGGQITLQGRYTPASAAFEGSAQVQGVRPATLHSRLDSTPVSGRLQARHQGEGVHFTADLRATGSGRAATARPRQLPFRVLQASGQWLAPRLSLHSIDLDALQARLRGRSLEIHLGGAPAVSGSASLALPGATATASGQLGPASGAGALQIDIAAAERTREWLAQWPALAPALDGLRLQGQARLDARWQGGWRGLGPLLPGGAASGEREDFRIDATASAPRLDLTLPGAARPVQGHGLRATLAGSLAQARLALEGQARLDGRAAHWDTRSQVRLAGASAGTRQWHADVEHLRLQWVDGRHASPWTLQLSEPLALTLRQAETATLQAGAGRATLTAPLPGSVALRWEPLRAALTGAPRWQTRGTFTGLPLAWAGALRAAVGAAPADAAALSGDLLLQGGWSLDWADELRASARLEHASGDLLIPTTAPAATPAGVRTAALEVEAHGAELRARLHWDSERAGRATADASTWLVHADGRWQWPANAPVAARVRASLPQMGVWSALAPPGWRVQGTLEADATLSGSRAAPLWQGQLGADQLALRSPADGVDLQGGSLRATLRGDRIDITELRLQGGPGSGTHIPGFSGNRTPAPRDGGQLQGHGSITWAGPDGIGMDLTVLAQALQVQVRADRQASVSGTVRATFAQGRLALRGQLKVDRAALLLPDETAPRLGSDVVVRPRARDPAPPAAPSPGRPRQAPELAITLDLGPDFALQGQGITTRLEGRLEIRGGPTPGAPPRVTGEVRTIQGRYRAWGQELDVEAGLIRFSGAHDNPALDILALRPHIAQRAGVQVSGSALAPRVRLYSEPELPDAEKLAWVVLGRGAASGGAEAALLQQAALALLGGKGNAMSTRIAGRLGLDEIGFKGPSGGEGASGAALTLGKRISQDLYVTYERSLSGTLGTLYIFYDLSRQLTLRGQTGASSALDLIYTLRYD